MKAAAGSVAVVLVLGALAYRAVAQSQTFDVVSIKVNKSGDAAQSLRALPSGQLVATNATVRFMILNAFALKEFEVGSGPDWTTTERYDLNAKSDRSNLTPNEIRLMLRSLLADRFKLRTRQDVQDRPFYALVVARPGQLGPNLRRVDGPCDPAFPNRQCAVSGRPGALGGRTASIPRLVQELTGVVERRVVDATGLEGLYDMDVRWSAEQQADGPSVFTALEEQLGLKLEARRGPVDLLVIDGVERPAEN